MSTPFDPAHSAPAPIPPEKLLAQLAAAREIHPGQALAEAQSQPGALTDPLLQALERGLIDPDQSFQTEGMLFNFAVYLLAKWREPRAYPLFLRWLSLPGETALELGGDTVAKDGSRLLASVCGGQVEPVKGLILNRDANDVCRAQAIEALAVLAGWGERPRDQVEQDYLGLAREGLERNPGVLWNQLALSIIQLEALSVFPELRSAMGEGLVQAPEVGLARLDEIEHGPRDVLFKTFVERHPLITDVVQETSWWAGFRPPPPKEPRVVGLPGQTYIAPEKVKRNDPCPCGSGKKFKKCCGA
jgi:hypothetical protein